MTLLIILKEKYMYIYYPFYNLKIISHFFILYMNLVLYESSLILYMNTFKLFSISVICADLLD